MNSKREQIWVGLFVLIAAALLIGTVLALTGAFSGSAVAHHSNFKSAGGLVPGATGSTSIFPQFLPTNLEGI